MTQRVGILRNNFYGAWIIARREIRDQLRDWRILTPIILLTLFFPLLMNFTASEAVDFVARYGADIVGERLIPFLLMVVGFFPISISLVIALESFAGERERLSLEPLLATPLTDSQLYLGKIIASVVPPLGAAFLGITVYLLGLVVSIGWKPDATLLAQILTLTVAQALVMVNGAVVISTQTTSVRAANLLASFIIVPMAELIIGESLIMFWGIYSVLWWIVVALIMISIVLSRMGLRLFNREELLGKEIDVIDLKRLLRHFRRSFVGNATSISEWFKDVYKNSLSQLKWSILITAGILVLGYVIGLSFADRYVLPTDFIKLNAVGEGLETRMREFGLLTERGLVWILWNNVRALLLSALLGGFTLGILGQILLMAPYGITGYLAGNVILAGGDPLRFLAALILPHAVFEFPAAVIAGAAILQLGLAALSIPKGMSLSEGFISALAQLFRIVLGIVLPLLVAAAVVEVYVTPRIALLLLG